MPGRVTDAAPSRMSHPPHPFNLNGRVALVTGSSTGIGKAIAIGLGRAGARVALNFANDAARAEKALADFRDSGGEGLLVRADVTNETEVRKMCAEISERLGPLDILVVNATCPQPEKPIEEYDWEFYQLMIDFFIKSPYLLTRQCLAHMKQQRWGRIINIGTEAFTRGIPNFSAYVAAKGGQLGWTRSVGTELARFGITVNMVSPGWIPVERHEAYPAAQKDAYRAIIPAARWGVPDDLSGAVVFLASDAASFITAQNLHVNGGVALT